jgi:subtilisin family serine protease
MEKAAVDYAVAKGVIIVASAGNAGAAGMGYPGAYAPVISVAAAGWVGEWIGGGSWWYAKDVPESKNADQFYIADFSSRQKAGQELDVAAPGTWVVGPYQTTSGQLSYYFLGGTSMASPHVAGIVALMAQKNPGLTAPQAEAALESSATPMAPACRAVSDSAGTVSSVCWGADAAGAGLVNAEAAINAVK